MSENVKNKKSNSPFSSGHGGPAGGLSKAGEKPKEFKKTGRKLMRYFKPYRIQFIAVIVFAILSVIFNILSPAFLGRVTDSIFSSVVDKVPIDFKYISTMLSLLVGLYVLSAGFRWFVQNIMAKVSQEVVYDMRKKMDEKMGKLPISYFDKHTHGEILSRFTNDVDTISNSLQQSLTQIIVSVATLFGILGMMLSISWEVTLICLAVLPISFFFTIIIAKKSQKYFAGQQKVLGELNGHVEEMFSGHNVVKAFGYEERSREIFDETNDELSKNAIKAQFVSGIIMPVMRFIGNLGYVIIAVAGALFTLSGRMTVGQIQAFIMYFQQFNQPIIQTAQIASILQSTIAAAERVFEFLEEEEMPKDGNVHIENAIGNVEFKDVSFAYDQSHPLIEKLNLCAHSGDTVAIVGPTGAGKTTLVNLLMRFYRVDSGEILVDGVNINDISTDELRAMFGMVLQDTWLFHGTIYDNIAYGRAGASEEEVIEASKMAMAHGFIKRLPQGYKTMINEEGSNVSAGQKQLLTIARAILKNPKILILDEATSSVDTRTESLIQKGMEALVKGRTNFTIAHRLSTIKNADMIIVMEKGHIVEKGNHDELMAKDGAYAKLYNSQFDEAE